MSLLLIRALNKYCVPLSLCKHAQNANKTEAHNMFGKSPRPINLPAVVLQTFLSANKTVGRFMFDKSPRLMNFSPLSLCKHFFLQSDSGDKFMFDKSSSLNF